MATVFDPLNRFNKSVTGAVCADKPVTFRISGEFEKVDFVFNKDGFDPVFIPMLKKGRYFYLKTSFNKGLFWYCFRLNNDKFVSCSEKCTGVIVDSAEKVAKFQLTVYDGNYIPSRLLNGGIIYQIFPDRFARSRSYEELKRVFPDKKIHKDLSDDPCFLPNENGEVLNDDFFGGDIKGITEKIPYLKSLNISAIYLNPICKAFSNHRYDTGDFTVIDELLGTDSDLKELIRVAKKSGVSIIIDGVYNHVGSDSVYFNKKGTYRGTGAYQSTLSPYYPWFTFNSFPEDYTCWWGIKTLPAVNEKEPSYVEYICGENGVISKFFGMGVKGVRLDVVDELPDEFVKSINTAVKRFGKNNAIIGEVWEDASNKISYGERREYFLGGELDAVINYPLKNALIEFALDGNAKKLSSVIRSQIDHYPKKVLDGLMNILSTHDTPRILSVLSGIKTDGLSKTELSALYTNKQQRDYAIFLLKAVSLLQYTVYGVPSVYYGDEIGMEGFFDPLNRRFFGAGEINDDLLSWFTRLGEIRRAEKVFVRGAFMERFVSDGVYAFERKNAVGGVFVIVSVRDGAEITLDFDGKLINLLDGKVWDRRIDVKGKFLGIFKKTC